MRKYANASILVITSLVATVVLWIASTFAAALAFGAIALIVPGTGTHNIGTVTGYKENAADRFIDPSGVDCTSLNGCDLLGVDYPASFWPIPLPGWCPGLTCDTWNKSVGEGVTNLNTQLATVLADGTNAGEQIAVFGYSQGGAVVSRAMYDIAELDEETRDRITVVTIGNINNPLGLWSRLSFLRYIPLLNVSFGPQLPTDIGVKSTNYSFEYDPVGDAPQYWGNPLAMLNALMAFEYVHGYYLDPNSNGPTDAMPYGYDDASLAAAIAAAPKRVHGDATFVLIPQRGTLPIFMPLVDIGNATGTSAFVEPVIRLLQPVTKLLIDLGYDRQANPGIARNLSILPFNPFTFNPIQFSVDFVEAIVQGIEDAFNGGSMIAVPVPAPADSEADELSAAGEALGRLAADSNEEPLTTVEQVADIDTPLVEETLDGDPAGGTDEQGQSDDLPQEESNDESLQQEPKDELVEDEDLQNEDPKEEDDLEQEEDVTDDGAEDLDADAEDADITDGGQDADPETDTAAPEEKAAA
ncbi:PE-PPE domain-containing protein [Mycolicibacterium monacense]|uniref:PE-PPE domain-containing protein n=1 Tax=Mycolicibacterium monacense TaxID=85693 RepID=A0AAD1N106_MYCMB|nr:PE-PPE domain-containing protein [Mycolicibacterium monacense]MDA4101845.1 PE-PPE [Mycolicibacterium monacense DSM 44395]ORB12230.1 PE-PPE domain-containing protein [Mycolicibacterium monacense DSM 44395]QHP84785.1 PE-PPE domain-containing protein [Mycolicibacterium monacense DSM 44395]BBZ62406.1 PE-PPE domain-containing protein [Mycolicibacterium monacense]